MEWKKVVIICCILVEISHVPALQWTAEDKIIVKIVLPPGD